MGEHLGLADDPGGFHHEGAVIEIPLEDSSVPERAEGLFVSVSQHEQRGSEPEPPFVEVQDHLRSLARLTPAECMRLAQALLKAAALLREEASTYNTWFQSLVADLENDTKDWLPSLTTWLTSNSQAGEDRPYRR
jgi:hypothetical protein